MGVAHRLIGPVANAIDQSPLLKSRGQSQPVDVKRQAVLEIIERVRLEVSVPAVDQPYGVVVALRQPSLEVEVAVLVEAAFVDDRPHFFFGRDCAWRKRLLDPPCAIRARTGLVHVSQAPRGETKVARFCAQRDIVLRKEGHFGLVELCRVGAHQNVAAVTCSTQGDDERPDVIELVTASHGEHSLFPGDVRKRLGLLGGLGLLRLCSDLDALGLLGPVGLCGLGHNRGGRGTAPRRGQVPAARAVDPNTRRVGLSTWHGTNQQAQIELTKASVSRARPNHPYEPQEPCRKGKYGEARTSPGAYKGARVMLPHDQRA
mmetsp:Transcript_106690/g.299778  ORF Transcript_106690/g.299778 Transcript_106690/m.299778 type:complete len:317 (+) Transcript_106690:359-1309(+)